MTLKGKDVVVKYILIALFYYFLVFIPTFVAERKGLVVSFA